MVLGLCYLFAIAGILILAIANVPLWAVAGSTFLFWMSGQMFLAAMIGNGKEGLGTKRVDKQEFVD